MNNQTQEALKMAIKALDDLELCDYETAHKALDACILALEQPAQEPYCWTVEQKNGLAQGSMCRTIEECKSNPLFDAEIDHIIPLYTHPHQWQGLTDDEIDKCGKGLSINYWPVDFARAIEAKLKEKNI